MNPMHAIMFAHIFDLLASHDVWKSCWKMCLGALKVVASREDKGHAFTRLYSFSKLAGHRLEVREVEVIAFRSVFRFQRIGFRKASFPSVWSCAMKAAATKHNLQQIRHLANVLAIAPKASGRALD